MYNPGLTIQNQNSFMVLQTGKCLFHSSQWTVILQKTIIIVTNKQYNNKVRNRIVYIYKYNIVQYEHVIITVVAVCCYLQIMNMGIKKLSR